MQLRNKKSYSFILVILLVCLNIVLLFTASELRNDVIQSERGKTELVHKIERYKMYLKSSLKPFCLTKNKILSTINLPEKENLNDSLIYVILIPANACSACVSSLFTELASSNINFKSLYLIIGKDSILLKKEWISFDFFESNCVEDRFDLIKACNLNKSPVFIKLIYASENCFFMNYEPGLSNQFNEFIEFNPL